MMTTGVTVARPTIFYYRGRVQACTAGQYSSSGASSCTVCPAGKYLTDAATDANEHDESNDCDVYVKQVNTLLKPVDLPYVTTVQLVNI